MNTDNEVKEVKEEVEKESKKQIKYKPLNFSIKDYFKELKFGSKISIVIGIIMVWLFLLFQAMNLMNESSDIAVIAAVVIFLFLGAVAISAFVVLCRKSYEMLDKL